MIKSIYVIGSLRNKSVPEFSNELEAAVPGIEAFSEWYGAGENADDHFRDYNKIRGKSYADALKTYAAKMIFEFDRFHLDRTDAAVMLMPAGRSANLELGYTVGRGKPGFILFDEVPERYDLMTQFATAIFFGKESFFNYLKEKQNAN